MKALKYVLLSLQYLPAVLTGVQAVQTSLGDTKGENKKSIVMAAIQAGAAVGEQVPEDHVKLISGLVDGVVGALKGSNIAGFKPSGAPIPVSAAPAAPKPANAAPAI